MKILAIILIVLMVPIFILVTGCNEDNSTAKIENIKVIFYKRTTSIDVGYIEGNELKFKEIYSNNVIRYFYIDSGNSYLIFDRPNFSTSHNVSVYIRNDSIMMGGAHPNGRAPETVVNRMY